jgi:tRNA(Ile)-lysidine synthase
MHPFEQTVHDALERFGARSARLLVAVSGGPDSMSLLHALHRLAPEGGLSLHAAHLDHGLRGEESTADAEWVRGECGQLDVPAIIEQCDVRAAAAERSTGIEETARQLRYEFFIRAAQSAQCPRVAVAHTADDQTETILHRVLRGTGLEGLRGMPGSRPLAEGVTLIRPLLEVRRAAVEDYLRTIGAEFRVDRTNVELDQTRNRIRNRLLPLLREEFNPQVDAALRRLGSQAAEVQGVLRYIVEDLHKRCLIDRAPDLARIDCGPLAGLPRHLVRETLRRVWEMQNWPVGQMTQAHWDAVADRALSGGTSLSLPGPVQATRRGALLVLQREK